MSARHLPVRKFLAAALCLFFAAPLRAERVAVVVEGIEGEMAQSVRASIELTKYEDRDVSPIEIRRLFEGAQAQIRTALEPFGYYGAEATGRLERPEQGHYRATFSVKPGEPVIVRKERVVIGGNATQLEPVKLALEHFAPKQGERLDHAAYERSKQEIATALANEGYVRAQLVQHRVEVVRADEEALCLAISQYNIFERNAI